MSVAAKAFILAVVAFFGGLGIVYAPVPTFTAVAATFALALWWFMRSERRLIPKVAEDEREKNNVRSTPTTRLVSGYLLLWWMALIAPLATYSPRGATSATVAIAAASGSLRNQVLVFSFGLVGALFLPTALKRFNPAFRWVAVLWGTYLLWAFVSLSWSVYPLLTLRSVGAFVLVSVGSFGLGAGFYGNHPNGRDLFLRHIFWAGVLSALVVVLPLPLHWSEYNLLDPAQRVDIGENVSMTTFVVRPVVGALLVLVATRVLKVRQWKVSDWFWVAILVLPLLALKARGPIVWGVLALAIFYLSYKARLRDRVMQAGLLLVIGIGTYVYYSEGIFGWLVPYLARGNVQSTENLTGRLPLWEVLIPEFVKHPWIGVGFAAFWNPANVYRIEELVGFPAVSAHNGFLEELLNTGVVGLGILLTFFACAMAIVIRRARQGDPFGWLAFLFMLFYLLLNLTNALIQEYLEVPLIVILGMLGVMSSQPIPDPPNPQRAPEIPRRQVDSQL